MTDRVGDFRQIFETVRANRERLDGCSKHQFLSRPFKLGENLHCSACGGDMPFTEASAYCEGYKAAGGDPGEVWPAVYRDDKDTGA